MMLSALSLIVVSSCRTRRAILGAAVLAVLLAIGCASSPGQGSTAGAPATSTAEETVAPTPAPSVVVPDATPTSRPVLPTDSSPGEVSTFVGSAAPDFPFNLFQGEDVLGDGELNLSDVIGQPIVLNFWARFCGPCWSEMPELQEFYEEQGEHVRLLGIDIGQFTGLGSPKDAGGLLDALGITYPAGYTDDASVVSKYRIRAMPTTVFIDSDGVVFHAWTGAIRRQQLESVLAEMLDRD